MLTTPDPEQGRIRVQAVPLVRTPEEVGGSGARCGQASGQCACRLAGLHEAWLEDLGVKRISVGGALARAAWGGFIRAAKDTADNGRFDAFADLPTMGEIAGAFAEKG